jgi:hypothetical protein
LSAVFLSCALIREGAEILEGGGLSSWSRLSYFPRETFLRLREAVESKSRSKDSCVEGSDSTSESTPLSELGEAISALELANRAAIVHEGLEMIHA